MVVELDLKACEVQDGLKLRVVRPPPDAEVPVCAERQQPDHRILFVNMSR